jgi:hypothetical protein
MVLQFALLVPLKYACQIFSKRECSIDIELTPIYCRDFISHNSQGHYSNLKSAFMMGIGTEGVISVNCDDRQVTFYNK